MIRLALALCLTAGAASAQESPPRCAVLGQVATSVWLETLTAVGAGARSGTDGALRRLDAVTATYARLGCEVAALEQVFDCVLDLPEEATARGGARDCLAAEGLVAE